MVTELELLFYRNYVYDSHTIVYALDGPHKNKIKFIRRQNDVAANLSEDTCQ